MPTQRPLTADDAAALCTLTNESWSADGIEMIFTLEEAAESLGGTHFDPATDSRGVFEGDVMIGYGRALAIPSETRAVRTLLDGTVHPDHRRRGIGTALLEWQIERGTELALAGSADIPRYLIANHYSWQEDAIYLFAGFGFAAVREFHEMLRTLDDIPSVRTADVDIVAWDPEHSEALRAVKNTAFQDHWGSTPTDAETWEEWMVEYGTRLDLSHMAMADGEVVGLALNGAYPADEEVLGRREGWIHSLAVHPDWRGRGVASGLLAASMRSFAAVDFTHAALGVDSTSHTGADRLYERMGFAVMRRSVTVRREVTSGNGPGQPAPNQN